MTPCQRARMLASLGLFAVAGTQCARDINRAPAYVFSVSPDTVRLHALGQTATLVATLQDGGSGPVSATVWWTSSDPTVATVSSAGQVRAAGEGSALVVASFTGVTPALTDTAVVIVHQEVGTVTVTPGIVTFSAYGGTQQLGAVAADSLGNAMPGATFTWVSSDTVVARVSAGGLVTARANGTAAIAAVAPNGWTGASVVRVLAAGRVVAGHGHACALTLDGAAYCWGDNARGQLGDGTTAQRLTPVAVAGGLSFTALTARSDHTCGLTGGGVAYCWGGNGFGQLGDGSQSQRTTPTAVAGGLTFIALAAGWYHTCGLTSGGAAYCWGRNLYGALGDGRTADAWTPVAVQGGRVFKALVAGSDHSCGLTGPGVTYCWGRNSSGQLGDGSNTSQSAPVAILDGPSFAELASGSTHTCGITSGGAVYCWGDNSYGELGDGSLTDRLAPVALSGGRTFVALTGGDYLTCGLASDGTSWCWGLNVDGQVGDGTETTYWKSPTQVAGGLAFVALAGGHTHACGLTSGGDAYCWGSNAVGALGTGSLSWSGTAVTVSAPPLATLPVGGAAGRHQCGLATGGAAFCWGENSSGQLGDGTTIRRTAPTAVTTAERFAAVVTGADHSCGLTSTGAAWCWGRNRFGELGDGTSIQRTSPTRVAAGVAFTRLAAGGFHTCGLTGTGAAYCWGYNAFGQLGDRTTTESTSPVPVSGGLTFASLSAGGGFTCGLTSAGAAYCWGSNASGQIGSFTHFINQPTPLLVSGGLTFTALSSGESHGCGLTSGGATYCWGRNTWGALGDGSTTSSWTPVAVTGGVVFAALRAGGAHTCGLTSDGTTYCWGWNGSGQVGDGTTSPRTTPAAVTGPSTFVAIAGGASHTCGVTAGGTVSCWGDGSSGILGPAHTNLLVPVRVAGGVRFRVPAVAFTASAVLSRRGETSAP